MWCMCACVYMYMCVRDVCVACMYLCGVCVYCVVYVCCVLFFETRSHSVALTVLELTEICLPLLPECITMSSPIYVCIYVYVVYAYVCVCGVCTLCLCICE